MKRKLDINKVGFAIAFIVTTALVINKIVQAGTIFCLTSIYQEETMKEILAEIKRYLIFQKNYYSQELKEFKNRSLKEKWKYIKLQRKIKKIL